MQPGWYLIDARCKDSYGQEVKITRYVELYDGVSGMPGSPQYAWALEETQTVEPGERAKVDIGSSAGNVFVIRTVDRTKADAPKPAAADLFNFFTLDKEKKRTEFPVTEADRGGFGVADVFV